MRFSICDRLPQRGRASGGGHGLLPWWRLPATPGEPVPERRCRTSPAHHCDALQPERQRFERGWLTRESLRLALARAQSARRSYWDSLRELGQRTQVDSLEEVAHSVQLAGEHGARIRQSLAAKAHALRARNLARIEHEAEQRTEHMGLPMVVLFLGFILLVGYPAFVGTVGAL